MWLFNILMGFKSIFEMCETFCVSARIGNLNVGISYTFYKNHFVDKLNKIEEKSKIKKEENYKKTLSLA